MWICFIIFFITIPAFKLFDRQNLDEDDFTTISNIVLSEDSKYDPGGGKSSTHSIDLHFEGTKRFFRLVYEEYQCINNSDILSNFKKGDTVSIKVLKGNEDDFYTKNFISGNTRIYGLSKGNKEFVNLNCTNKVAVQKNNAGIIASSVAALLSLLFATRLLRPKTKYEAIGSLPIDPVFIVLLSWLAIVLALR
jgi:hypothetical protein